MRPAVTNIMIQIPPLQWYIDLILAGLRSFGAPEFYLKKVLKIVAGPASSYLLGGFDKAILKYPGTIKNILIPSLTLIDELNKGGEFTLKASRHALNRRKMNIIKEPIGFSFETSVVIKRGIQSHHDLIIDNPDLILSGKYRVDNKGFVATNITYGENEKWITGGIHQIETLNLTTECFLALHDTGR